MFLVIVNYILILNISTTNICKEEYIQQEIYNYASINDIIYSKSFDKNEIILKYRKNIETLYTLSDILNIDVDKINQLIDSKIFKEVFTKISMNIVNSIKYNREYQMFSIEDYNKIVYDNIDDILESMNINLNTTSKNILVNLLKKIGSKSFDDVSSTKIVIDYINPYKVNLLYILTSNNIRVILIIMDIILFLIFLILEFNIYIIKDIFKIIVLITILLIISNLYLLYFGHTYTNEWYFVQRVINKYNSNICIYEILNIIMVCIFILINKIEKRTIF